MSISHLYRSYEVLERSPSEHEVPALGLTLPDEASAHRAIDHDLRDWVDGYGQTQGTPSAPVASPRSV
jgi:hypothetical protein